MNAETIKLTPVKSGVGQIQERGNFMKTSLIILGICAVAIHSLGQDWSRSGGSTAGAGSDSTAIRFVVPPVDGKYIRQIGTNVYDTRKSGWTWIVGDVTSESDGLAVVATSLPGIGRCDVALKNYPGTLTTSKKISVYAMENGIYKWGNIPLQIYDCGTPYTPPPPTPEQIAAARAKKELAAKSAEAKAYQAQLNAVHWLQPLATNGSLSAQCSLGTHYLNGQGCETNRELAFYWLKKAADQGDVETSNKLATLKQ
jgi:hypothetical protein